MYTFKRSLYLVRKINLARLCEQNDVMVVKTSKGRLHRTPSLYFFCTSKTSNSRAADAGDVNVERLV